MKEKTALLQQLKWKQVQLNIILGNLSDELLWKVLYLE
jgi:hypothetical protein